MAMTADQAKSYFANYKDVADAFTANPYGLDQTGFANAHYTNYGSKEGRTWAPLAAATPAPAQAPTPTATASAPPATPPPMTAADVNGIVAAAMKSNQANTPAPPPVAQAAAPQVTAATSEVDPTKTAFGLVNSNLASDSTYLTQARKLAQEEMAGRGLLSSSMAAGAATGAAINAAGQLAVPDAQIYANQQLANQTAQNTVNLTNAGNQVDVSKFNAGAANTVSNLGYQNQLTQSTAVLQGTIAAALSQQALGQDLTKMGVAQTYDLSKMNYGAALDITKMKYGADLDLTKLAVGQGYTMDQLAQVQANDLAKIGVNFGNSIEAMKIGAGLDLTKLAAANGYDKEKMGLANDYEIQRLVKSSELDVSAKTTLLALSYKYDSLTKSSQFAAGFVGQKLTDINKILADPDISNESQGKDANGNPLPSPKQQMIDAITNGLPNAMDALDKIYGTNLGGSFAAVQTPAATPAPTPAPGANTVTPASVSADVSGP